MALNTGNKVCWAAALDLAVGEPPERWHPVCWLGRLVGWLDRRTPGRHGSPRTQRLAGSALALGLPAGTWLLTRAALKRLPGPLADGLEVALLSTALAGRSLYQSAGEVDKSLSLGLEQGRASVARIVGRETAGLDEAGVVRAAVESVAENSNDGVIAPLFYGLVGGAPLALAFKAVNTLDSMVGYRHDGYRDFGWASARLDDLAGFIPARLTALAALAVSPAWGQGPRQAWRVWRRDARGHASPNAGVVESVFAGTLGVQLGGDNRYGGEIVPGAKLGAGLRPPERSDIGRADALMYAAAAAVLAAGTLAGRFYRRRRGS